MSDAAIANTAQIQAFSFGDPEPVLSRRELFDHIECWHNGRWYDPPVSLEGLARAYRASPHHSSAIILKRNLLVASFEPSPRLSRADFEALAQDYLVFGNAYLERRDNRLGGPLRLVHAMARYTRRGLKDGQFFFVPGHRQEHAFKRGSVCHIFQPDVSQEIYGLPEYLSALQAALLNEAATLFRRKYYLNGSHAGYILYMTSSQIEQESVDGLRLALKESRGPGNFRNLFLHAPGGDKDGIRLIPISEVAAKDEFLGIKNVSRDDVLAAHRVPPQLLGIVPMNAGGFGDVGKAEAVFHELEIKPLQARFLAINDWLGEEVVRFKERAQSPS